LRYTPLAGERLRPLGHISVGGSSENGLIEQALTHHFDGEYFLNKFEKNFCKFPEHS